jgi:alpha-glucosidase
LIPRTGFLPGRGHVIWRDWYTHAIVRSPSADQNTVDLDASLGHIPVLIRSGAALLLHSQPGYTTRASALAPYAILISLSDDGHAYGTALIDDGETLQLSTKDIYLATQSRTLVFTVHNKSLEIWGEGSFSVVQPLDVITILGINLAPRHLQLNKVDVPSWKWVYNSMVQRLVVSNLSVDLNDQFTLAWW